MLDSLILGTKYHSPKIVPDKMKLITHKTGMANIKGKFYPNA